MALAARLRIELATEVMMNRTTDGKRFIPAPTAYDGQTTTGAMQGIYLADDEDVNWIKNSNGEAIGYTITKNERIEDNPKA